jgi:hypothetical protein
VGAIFAEFQRHVVTGFNKRLRQMDCNLARLALFLDPRCRRVACMTEERMEPLAATVSLTPRLATAAPCCRGALLHCLPAPPSWLGAAAGLPAVPP